MRGHRPRDDLRHPGGQKWHEDEPKRPRYAGDDADAYWYTATDTLVAAAVKTLPEDQRHRFHPFLSGFNPNDKNSDAHIRRMLELDPGLWQGIGEVFTRHDDLTALIDGDTRAPTTKPCRASTTSPPSTTCR